MKKIVVKCRVSQGVHIDGAVSRERFIKLYAHDDVNYHVRIYRNTHYDAYIQLRTLALTSYGCLLFIDVYMSISDVGYYALRPNGATYEPKVFDRQIFKIFKIVEVSR